MKTKIQKIIIFALMISLAFCGCSLPAYAAYPGELAKLKPSSGIILVAHVEESSGEMQLIFDQNSQKKTSPAALTKVLNALVVLQNRTEDKLQETVTVKAATVHLLEGTGAAMAGLQEGEKVTIEQLLNCMLIGGSNDAALVLAEHIGGSQAKFVEMMNQAASALGCTNTTMKNAHGLDAAGHESTAQDMLKISMAAMQYPTFQRIVDEVEYTMPKTNKSEEYTLYSVNHLLRTSRPEYNQRNASGIMAGYTEGAGYCVVTRASRSGYTYYAVIMQGRLVKTAEYDEANSALLDCKNLLNWTFENINLVSVASATQIVAEIPVALSSAADFVRLVPAEEKFAMAPVGVDENAVLLEVIPESLPEEVLAPIKKGDVLGKARVLYAENEITTVDLVAESDISMNIFLYIGYGIRLIVSSVVFQLVLVVLVLVAVGYVALVLVANRKRKREQQLHVVNYRDVDKKKKKKK